jgi:hypothetical protein
LRFDGHAAWVPSPKTDDVGAPLDGISILAVAGVVMSNVKASSARAHVVALPHEADRCAFATSPGAELLASAWQSTRLLETDHGVWC